MCWNDPVEQSVHAVEALVSENLPAEHELQEVAPAVS